jgi:hypothetical protein
VKGALGLMPCTHLRAITTQPATSTMRAATAIAAMIPSSDLPAWIDHSASRAGHALVERECPGFVGLMVNV